MKKFLYILLCVLIVSPCAIFLSACATPKTYAINVKTSDARYGSVSGNGTFTENTTVTLRATPLQDANFLCWTFDNKVVSRDSELTFQITNENDGTYVALFDKALDYYALTEVDLILNDGAQINELKINISAGPSLASLQTIYNKTTSNPVIKTQKFSTIPNFYSGKLIHKKTTDESYHTILNVSATNAEGTRNYNENIDLNFDDLYYNNEYTINNISLSGYGTLSLTFKKLNINIVADMFKA